MRHACVKVVASCLTECPPSLQFIEKSCLTQHLRVNYFMKVLVTNYGKIVLPTLVLYFYMVSLIFSLCCNWSQWYCSVDIAKSTRMCVTFLYCNEVQNNTVYLSCNKPLHPLFPCTLLVLLDDMISCKAKTNDATLNCYNMIVCSIVFWCRQFNWCYKNQNASTWLLDMCFLCTLSALHHNTQLAHMCTLPMCHKQSYCYYSYLLMDNVL